MKRTIVDRLPEQRVLREAWESGRAELVVVHGRRRVGKTALLAHFAARRPVAFYVAAQQLRRDQLADLGQALGPLAVGVRPGQPPRLAIDDWSEALTILADAATRRRVGLVLDEFPYLVDADPSLPSVLQRWWDGVGSRRNLVLILSGSEQAMMHRLTSSEGALHGRPTRAIWLRPFDYFHAGRFVTAWSAEDRIRAYAVAGGMPDYLEEFQPAAPFRDELLRLAYSPDGRFFREAPDLLRAEFSEPKTYESILRAMARGEHQPARIADLAGLKGATALGPYLERLMALELVERQVPPLHAAEPRPRTSRYVVADPYLRFYFALVDPWRSAVLLGHGPRALDTIWPTAFDEHVSRVFEDVAAQYVRRLAGAGVLPVLQAVGRHWLVAGDVDVVGVAGKRVIVAGSAKWRRSVATVGDLAALQRDARLLSPTDEPELILFSRSGFEPALRRMPGLRLVRPTDLFAPWLDADARATRAGGST
jgi:AAA+ ATPase superfamily predicted ATPase